MKKWYKVKCIQGRFFVIQFPYTGEDAVWLKGVINGFAKPCKIVAIAKEGTEERYYQEHELEKIIEDEY